MDRTAEDLLAANFHEVFRDVSGSKPEPGDCMARYSAVAYLDDGGLKRTIVQLLREQENGARLAATLMTRVGKARNAEAVRVPMEIAADLAAGMEEREVWEKPYRFVVEAFYYVKPEYVPADDPHWMTIPLKMCMEKPKEKADDQ